MKKLSERIELLIAVDVATKGRFYQKNNWNKTTSDYDAARDYVNFKFDVVARKKVGFNGLYSLTRRVKVKDDLNDLDYDMSMGRFHPTEITRFIPYSEKAVHELEKIRVDLKKLADDLTKLFAKRPENTTAALVLLNSRK